MTTEIADIASEEDFVKALSQSVKSHGSVNHPLYERLVRGEKLNRDGLFRFCAGYHDMAQGYLGVASTGILEQGKKDQGVLMAMTKTLHSELGFGNPKAVHHEYFLDFPESQSIPRAKILAAPPVPASEEYNNGLIGLYSGDFLEFLGAQAAFEMDAKEMIHKIHEAARRYTTDPDALAYFHLHLWFEDAHVDWIVEAMRPHLKKELAHLKVSNGFYKELELKKRWLDGLYKFTFDGN